MSSASHGSEETDTQLAARTTLGVGGPAGRLVTASSTEELRQVVRSVEQAGDPDALLILGGGSNLIMSDHGFPGTVVAVAGGTIAVSDRNGDRLELRAEAGVGWDDLVAESVERNCTGIEMMSGVPGSVGAAPIQNIGAYGQQVCDVIERVEVLDRTTLEEHSLTAEDCGFAFRTSRLKEEWAGRFVVLGVTFVLPVASTTPPPPSTYVDIVKYFEGNNGSPVDVGDRRRAVLVTRAMKSMLVDETDPNARSVGSFFVNPTVPIELAEHLAKEFQTIGLSVQYLEGHNGQKAEGHQRIPAAHVLRFAGFNPGDTWGNVGLSTKHVLALVTKPGATATDVWNVASHMQHQVEKACNVRLSSEATFIGEFPPARLDDFESIYEFRPGPRHEPEWLTSYR